MKILLYLRTITTLGKKLLYLKCKLLDGISICLQHLPEYKTFVVSANEYASENTTPFVHRTLCLWLNFEQIFENKFMDMGFLLCIYGLLFIILNEILELGILCGCWGEDTKKKH